MDPSRPLSPRRAAWQARALAWRARLVPEWHGFGWAPFAWLVYLGFLMIVPVYGLLQGGVSTQTYVLTFASIPPFLWLYFRAFRHQGWPLLPYVLAIGGLGLGLAPFNPFANTYMIYAAAFAPMLGSLRRGLIVLQVLLGLYALQSWWFGFNLFSVAIAVLVGVAVCLGNNQFLQKNKKDAELRLSHEEIGRLARVAERERIGRDLHDLLGHTLSLIALKSELARKLIDRDPVAARAEVVEVERVAREALAQVRRAVTGIRAAAMKPELASARLLLDGAGVRFDYSVAEIELTPAQETCLALVLREAVTNIHRHARAGHAEASLRREHDAAVLTVLDDGCGGAGEHGNGLRGMAERLAALGGELRVVSTPGQGTRVVASVPLPPRSGDDSGVVTPLRRSAA
jgi:two-component system sensor histidine kinase DesK